MNEGAVSREEFQHTGDSIAELRATLASAREQLNATTAQIDGTTVANNPQVLAAAAALRDASLALRRTRIKRLSAAWSAVAQYRWGSEWPPARH